MTKLTALRASLHDVRNEAILTIRYLGMAVRMMAGLGAFTLLLLILALIPAIVVLWGMAL